MPDIAILQLGMNDLTVRSVIETGSAIEDLVHLLSEPDSIKIMCICQTIYWEDMPSINKQVTILTRYLKGVLEL